MTTANEQALHAYESRQDWLERVCDDDETSIRAEELYQDGTSGLTWEECLEKADREAIYAAENGHLLDIEGV